MIDSLRANAVQVTSISTAVELKRESAGLSYHLARIRHTFSVMKALRKAPGDASVLYVVPDAGLGAWYTLAYLCISHARFDKVIFHHRSFAYISRFSRPMALMARLTKKKSLHVCLSEGMAKNYAEIYGPVRTMVVTNAGYVANEIVGDDAAVSKQVSLPTILGHLSTLRRDKGFFDVAQVFEILAQKDDQVELLLAGPITEPQVAVRIEEMRARYGNRVKHLGLISGAAKIEFYRLIDLFLFPTRHPQEAQPNVLFEALAAGVPVIATPRAAIPEMIVGQNGYCSPSEAQFVDFAVATIQAMSFEENVRARRKDAILRWIRQEARHSQRQYLDLMVEFGLASDRVKAPWLH
ncbi:MAG: glycosyltransferase [Candidatus Andeanibacterium colombiense]|uniref:Glycosyltransferase n=1 Tax=Candidatus Andeanibacterium colombiense TaxID=3121345 RepID=A0AAJ6BM94_9SPHN|nr:MAG: glycosyltransferase [Sphingomonadaceae bacterium]